MGHASPVLALAAAGAVAAGCGAQPGEDPYAPRAGLWQVSTGLNDLALPYLSPEAEADRRAQVGDERVERYCLPGRAPRAGEPRLDGRCTYSSVQDRGPLVHRTASCTALGRREPYELEIRGTRSNESYSLTVVSQDSHPIIGDEFGWIEFREEGRWLGPCPEAAHPPQ